MSDLGDIIMNRGIPTAGGTPVQGMGTQPNPLILLLQRLIMKQGAPGGSSPSVFDARDAMNQHNQQLEQSLNYR